MKTTFDLEDILFQSLNNSSLKTAITGSVCKGKRPMNSTKEDVVIKSLPVNNLPLQNAIVNVNVYVPNKAQSINGVQDDSQPDTKRLKQLAELAVPLLCNQWQDDLSYDVQQQVMYDDAETKSHFINIRVEFFSINILN